MQNSTLILGPPGCGKTYRLMEIVREALSNGVKPWEIGFMSFTRRAVQEASERAGKEFGFEKKDMPFFKTLHSLGFTLLGLKREDVMGPADWNNFAEELGLDITGKSHQGDGLSDLLTMGAGLGDRYLRIIERAAMRQVPLEQEFRESEAYDLSWPMVKRVDELLNIYRAQLGKVTFSDMLKMFLDFGEAPRLRLLIIDEAQDLVPLQWAVVNKLADRADEVYFAGDDDQAIHRWAGVEVKQFLDCSPKLQILTQSYRLPQSVFNLSQQVVGRIRQRVPKEYRPVDRRGSVFFEHSRDHLDLTSGSWTLMTRANYMAAQWASQLRDDGYLFQLNGNRSIRESLTTALDLWDELCSGGEIYQKEVKDLYNNLSKGHLQRGAKKLLEATDPAARYSLATLEKDFGLLLPPDPDRLQVIKMTDSERSYIRALERRGEDVTKEPRIKVGTIHSTKGGEDDNVAVDLTSTRAAIESEHPDDEHRVFYVGVTRAKNKLHVIQSRSKYRYDL